MITRRTVLGAGVAAASLSYTANFAVYGQTMRSPDMQRVDALLIDKSIEMPSPMASFIMASRKRLPVFPIELDVAGHTELMRVLKESQAIIGISSGATLFCVERLAWDHGYRLTGRSQQCVGELGNNVCQKNVDALLKGAHTPTASLSPLARAYRPSREDEMLHAWMMQRTPTAQLRQTRRDV